METNVCLLVKTNNISTLFHKQESHFPNTSLCFLNHNKKQNFKSDFRGRQTKEKAKSHTPKVNYKIYSQTEGKVLSYVYLGIQTTAGHRK